MLTPTDSYLMTRLCVPRIETGVRGLGEARTTLTITDDLVIFMRRHTVARFTPSRTQPSLWHRTLLAKRPSLSRQPCRTRRRLIPGKS
jgi:hypothetical protein